MKIFTRVLIGLALVLAAAFIGVYIYLQTLKPQLNGELKFAGLSQDAEVFFDQYGVPHIYAGSEEDAYAALGYVHAQDRLFQMEMLRRAASGRLSEVLGREFVKYDKLFRTLGLNEFAKKNADAFLSSDTALYQRAVMAYLKGVNKFVAEGPTPLEFSVIGIPKTPFTREDVYLAIGYMSLTFANGFQADPVLQKIHDKLGDQYLSDLAINPRGDEVRLKTHDGKALATSDSLISLFRDARNAIPIAPFVGSNGWVIGPQKSASGNVILANDTHIHFSQPAVWYEAHLEYPGQRFYGHFLAGFPFGVLGNNNFCAWGITMFENDDVDFFIEQTNPANANEVKFKDTWETMNVRKETIRVKGEKDVVIEVKSTRHGPLIDGIVDNIGAERRVSVTWQLLEGLNEDIQALYLIQHASTFAGAELAVSKIYSPGLNMMYGDINGNIAWYAAARLPIRPAHANGKFFLDGASGNDEYLGYYDFKHNPHSVNPPSGYVYSANNQPDSVSGVLYPGYYYPATRSGRIEELLKQKEKFTFEDMKAINLDNTSLRHADIAHAIASRLSNANVNNDPSIDGLRSILAEWKGDHTVSSVAPSVYYNMLSQLYWLAMEDELGKDALTALLETAIMKNSVASWIRNEQSAWWDNLTTQDKKESINDIFLDAARNTIARLKESCGEKSSDWTWGKIHTLTHEHPLGKIKPLDRFFNVGPFAVDGGSEVVNNLDFDYTTRGIFPVIVGPALRKITDLGNIESGETVSPTGQSGNVMSPHYKDQAELFVNGQFRKMLMNKAEIEANSSNRLMLKR